VLCSKNGRRILSFVRFKPEDDGYSLNILKKPTREAGRYRTDI